MPRLIRLPLQILAWLTAVGLAVVLGVAATVLLNDRPLPETQLEVTATERAWVKRWIAENKPRAKGVERLTTLSLSEQEANVLLNAVIDKVGQGGAHLRLDPGRAQALISLRLPFNWIRSYLNLELGIREGSPLPEIESARIAGLPIPHRLAHALARQTLESIEHAQILDSLSIDADRVTIRYNWRPNMLEHLGSGLIARADRPHVLRYQERLFALTADAPRRKSLQLGPLLAAMLREASSDPETDPITANRAAIIALAAYVNGRIIHDPALAEPRRSARPRVVRLRGRRDLAQHFVTSAALTVSGNDTLSSLAGWYKEVSDSDGGSGFSFADMTANRAGIRFAKLATHSDSSARRLQRLASGGLDEDDFMPPVNGLPEGMTRQGFTNRFGDAKTPAYSQLIKVIDLRIAERPLFDL